MIKLIILLALLCASTLLWGEGLSSEKISKQNKTAIFLGMENGFPIATDFSRVKAFYDLGVRSICNHNRNMSDKMIRKLAENGGVIQICILGAYIREADYSSQNTIKKKRCR